MFAFVNICVFLKDPENNSMFKEIQICFIFSALDRETEIIRRHLVFLKKQESHRKFQLTHFKTISLKNWKYHNCWEVAHKNSFLFLENAWECSVFMDNQIKVAVIFPKDDRIVQFLYSKSDIRNKTYCRIHRNLWEKHWPLASLALSIPYYPELRVSIWIHAGSLISAAL